MKLNTIAEIGQAHDGSIGILHSYIDALSKTGVDVIKFQMHFANEESSKYERFRVNFSYQDKSRFDYWKRMELTQDQWLELKKHCDENKVEFLCTPFSIKAIKLLEKLNVKRYKIGSADLTNKLLLEHVCKTKKDIIISTGLSSIHEIDNTVSFLKQKKMNITILECLTKYPHSPNEVNLQNLNLYKKRYKCDVGLSDHSGSIIPSIAAASIGANLLEFHSVFSKEMFGPDSSSSLTIKEIAELVNNLKIVKKIRNKSNFNKSNVKYSKIFSRSLILNKSKKINDVINLNDLEAIKPSGKGIDPKDLDKVLKKRLNKNKKKYAYLKYTDLI